VIEEDERADHAALRGRQHAPDFELAEIARARLDEQLHGAAGLDALRLECRT
jgi:hypothetical protein